jgi:hypothetical protein
MKKTLLFASTLLISLGLLAQEQKEVITGADYANDVYYSLQNGTVTTVDRDNWDIGFFVNYYSAGIVANNGSGVELYTYPDVDISDWATLDTAGMDWPPDWPPMYNSIESFEEGAFNANALEHPDYGWGILNMVGEYPIVGDSLFVIRTISGAWKKLAIIEKNSTTNIWEFKYANLDGTGEQTVSLNAGDYNDKYFIHYSIDSMKIQDREPAKDDWDMLFTKFKDYINWPTYSPVSGVLTNDHHVLAQEVRESGMNQATQEGYVDTAFADTISIIGSDWKRFDTDAMEYVLNDTVVYYLKTDGGEANDSYYKLYFTGFSGGSFGGLGVYTFMQEKLTFVSAEEHEFEKLLEVYPNPASDRINVVFDLVGRSEIDIIDITGRLVRTTRYDASGFTNLSLDVSSLNPGVFFVRVSAEGESNVLRFIKE